MITNPKNGWCSFSLGDFLGSASYLTDVPCDLLDAFLNFHEHGAGVAVFDEEGSFFTMVLTKYNNGIFLIEERDTALLHDFSDLDIYTLEDEVIADIENDIDAWASNFTIGDDAEEIEKQRMEIWARLKKLKSYRRK